MKRFTKEDLKKHDGGISGAPVYIAFNGKVYDVTNSPLFIDGIHFEHYAGRDLTDDMPDAPHSEEALATLTVVGEYSE
ncbi:MAG: cytochrome B5 [Deltaproteobacteria bacterium]|nr:cytochrome B5 [Deltaproteobacteria bacterium]